MSSQQHPEKKIPNRPVSNNPHDESSPLIVKVGNSSTDDSKKVGILALEQAHSPPNDDDALKNVVVPKNFFVASHYNLTPIQLTTSSGYPSYAANAAGPRRGGLLGNSIYRLDSMELTPKIKNISTKHDKAEHDDDSKLVPPLRTKSNSHIDDILQPDIDPPSSQFPPPVQYSKYTNHKRATMKSTHKKVPKSVMSHLSYIVTDESSLSDDMRSPDDEDDDHNASGQHGFFQSKQKLFRIPRQKRGIKRGLLLLTVAFIIGTVAHRNYQPSDGVSSSDENEPHHPDIVVPMPTDPGTVCKERVMTNHQAIMALKDTSSVSDIPNGAVSTDDERCSELGVFVMKHLHGNAMDAAVTATLCLGLVNPASSGIGGGAFILVHSTPRNEALQAASSSTPFIDRRSHRGDDSVRDKSSKWTEVIDCRESAPSGATFDMFEDLPIDASTVGPLSIAVPGELRGLELAHARFGSLSWSQVVQPVIELGERGVRTSNVLAKEIMESKEKLQQFETIHRIFTKNNDGKTYLNAGDIMTRPAYIETLKNVAMHGADYIYTGEVAAEIAKEIQDAGGIITEQDIQNYKPILRDALIANINDFSVVSVPPPSSGGATIIGALRFLSGYKNPFASFADTLSVHRLVEAFKHVFAIRMSMSDPDFSPNVTSDAVQDLISGPFMEHLRANTLDDDILPLSEYGGKWALVNCTDDQGNAQDAHEGDRRLRSDPSKIRSETLNHRQRKTRLFNYLEDHGTTHLNVVDKDRNSVSITSSVNYYFGSNFASPSTGIIFNDVMDDFSTPGRPNAYGLHPAESNYIFPNKRPLSSMSPTMIFDASGEKSSNDDLGKLMMVLGASGGPKIISSVIQVILNHIYLGMPIFSAISHPRVHNQLLYHGSAATGYDKCPLIQGPLIETPNRTINALRRRNHTMISLDYLGTCQAISVDIDTGYLNAASDLRKDGKSFGY